MIRYYKNENLIKSRLRQTHGKTIMLLGIYGWPRCRLKCSKGHTFTKSIYRVLYGSCCTVCYPLGYTGHKRSHQEFVKQVKKLHPNIRVLGKYYNERTPIKLYCKFHKHTWKTKPENTLRGNRDKGGNGCPLCGYELQKRQPHKTDSFTFSKKFKKINPHLTQIDNYTNLNTNIQLQCKNCKCIWKSPPKLYFRNCPQCLSKKQGYSNVAIKWLKNEAKKLNIKISHAKNYGEVYIPDTRYRVDGFAKPNLIFEFLGDVWHGNPKLFKLKDKPHPKDRNLTANQLYKQTVKRLNHLVSLGYKVKYIWEADFYQGKSSKLWRQQ